MDTSNDISNLAPWYKCETFWPSSLSKSPIPDIDACIGNQTCLHADINRSLTNHTQHLYVSEKRMSKL